jgi:small multidrug resistance pump
MLSINAHIDFQSAGWLVVFSFAGVECVRFPDGTRELAKPTMGTRTIAVLVTIAFSVIGVLGDYFLKLASAREQPLRTGWFYLGFALYASTAFGWVFVMKHLKLATISVLYSVSLVLLLTAIGVVLFRESLNYFEVIGIVLAVVSLVLLMRFA